MSTQTPEIPDYIEYIESHKDEYEKDLFELLSIPSISSQSEHDGDVAKTAQWICDRLTSMNLDAQVVETTGHPAVFAQTKNPNPDVPTILFYGHYDVQPVDPLNLWKTPPFEPVINDGFVYARGASDDKGQMFTHILGPEAWYKTTGSMPVNVKYILEGDEESGGDAMDTFVRNNADLLACDCVVISDSQMFAPGRPAICYGLRGLAYVEVIYKGPDKDLHSGTFGGAVTNPAIALCKAIAGVHDDRYKITFPDFYADVKPMEPVEQERIAALGIDETAFLASAGVTDSVGENGYTITERHWARPTFDVNGIVSGYTGEGSKTVLPAVASAKMSCRLVPYQDPEKIVESIKQYFQNACPPGITMEFITHSYTPAVIVDVNNPFVKAAAKTLEKAFGRSPEFTRDGGSIPIVSAFTEALDSPVLLLGWGQITDNIHSPNERFCLADFHRGIKASAILLKQLAGIEPKTASKE